MIVAGHQPNYLPYLGFFDKIRSADLFIIEDNLQFERQGFTNRNRIMTAEGIRWLSVPIEHARKPLLIKEARIANQAEPDWKKRHLLTLKHSYCKAPFWNEFCNFFYEIYEQKWELLIDLNIHLIKGIMDFLGIKKPLILSSSLGVAGKKTELIIAQCKQLGADTQLAGNGCRQYIDSERFKQEGVKLTFQKFVHPIYKQTCPGFIPNLSVVDYLFCTGGKAW